MPANRDGVSDSSRHAARLPVQPAIEDRGRHSSILGRSDEAVVDKDDISPADMGRLVKTLRAAERARTALPAGGKHPLWGGRALVSEQPTRAHGLFARDSSPLH